jgi:hypothetical protein
LACREASADARPPDADRPPGDSAAVSFGRLSARENRERANPENEIRAMASETLSDPRRRPWLVRQFLV